MNHRKLPNLLNKAKSLSRFIPELARSIFNRIFEVLGFKNMYLSVMKKNAELEFQREYVKQFRENVPLWLEHYTNYRYLGEINKICKITENTKILDVGCGISTVLHYIDGERYGVDPLADEYKKLYSYPQGINIMKGSGEKIPFPNEFFSIVFCCNALDHVTDLKKPLMRYIEY